MEYKVGLSLYYIYNTLTLSFSVMRWVKYNCVFSKSFKLIRTILNFDQNKTLKLFFGDLVFIHMPLFLHNSWIMIEVYMHIYK